MVWLEPLRKHLQVCPDAVQPPGSQTVSSVLVPIGRSRETGRDEILLTKRTNLVETHKGQISFPGGRYEEDDRDLMQTALRESAEEIGTKSVDIDVLGPLRPVLTRGDVIIYPWVGALEFPYPFKLNANEVD